MKPKDYRRLVKQKVKNAATRQGQPQLQSSVEPSVMCQSLETQTAILNDDDAKLIEQLVQNQNADHNVRAAAVARLGFGDQALVNLEQLIAMLADADESDEVRLQAILKLEDASFERIDFIDIKPQYFTALRACIDSTNNQDLLLTVLDVLTANKDTFVQEKLLSWVNDPSTSPIPTATALQLLGNDIRAGLHDTAKQVLATEPDENTRIEALRILASDSNSQQYFNDLLRDKTQSIEARRLALSAIKSIAPESYNEQAMTIAADESEDDGLRATAVIGFTTSVNFFKNNKQRNQLKEICDKSNSVLMKRVANRYLKLSDEESLARYDKMKNHYNQ